MNTSDYIKKVLPDILEDARFAPSVHNTQPWLVAARDNTVVVSIDNQYRLSDGDPTGRQTSISLGIFCEALLLCARYYGLAGEVHATHTEARISFSMTDRKSAHATEAKSLLRTRVTDRSIYTKTDISEKIQKQIESAYQHKDVKIFVRCEQAFINKTATLTAKGIRIALSSPNFRRELSNYLLLPWSKRLRGISVNSLHIPRLVAYMEPVFMRLGLGLSMEAKLEKQRWLSASGIVCIVTVGDISNHWFNAGRAYLNVALEIERLGLAQATSAATVEASDFHEDIEKLLGTTMRLQSVMRIGVSRKAKKHSPRIPVQELLATSD